MKALWRILEILPIAVLAGVFLWCAILALNLQRIGNRIVTTILSSGRIESITDARFLTTAEIRDSRGDGGEIRYETLTKQMIGKVTSYYTLSGPVVFSAHPEQIPGQWHYRWKPAMILGLALVFMISVKRYMQRAPYRILSIWILFLMSCALTPVHDIESIREYLEMQQENYSYSQRDKPLNSE